MTRTVYLTCELKSRDLDSRLLLAAHLLKLGHDVVVGQQWSMFKNAGQCPKGVYLFKTPNRVQVANMRMVRSHGHIVVAMDEEVLALVDPLAIRLPTDPHVFDAADVFMYQNEAHRSVFERAGPVVGNTRVDLLRSMRALYEAEADIYRARGPYVLINTNCTVANSIWGDPQKVIGLTLSVWQADLGDPAVKAYIDAWLETENKNVNAITAFLSMLAPRLPRHRIVVRPHPAENADTWRKAWPGIEVVAGSNPLPWILGADLTVHSNSTTGLEAALMDCVCLNLNAPRDNVYSRAIATNDADFQALTAEAAVEAAVKVLNEGMRTPNGKGWMPDFPDNAAMRVAAEIAARAVDGAPVTGWAKAQRRPVETEKFSATFEEVSGRLLQICSLLRLPRVAGGVLDDSLFWFGPPRAA